MEVLPFDWSDRHKKLGTSIRKEEHFTEVIRLALELHKDLHTANTGEANDSNRIDALFNDLDCAEYAIMPTAKDETIAWAIWHIARIEDLTMNVLVANKAQVFDEGWKKRMNSPITDTGNAMSDDEILYFSKRVAVDELLKYRDAVGIRSREIIRELNPPDFKRKISQSSISRILEEGGVTEQPDSIWLLDYWRKKDVAGIVLMPLTRHQTLHLNDCYKWKELIQRKKK